MREDCKPKHIGRKHTQDIHTLYIESTRTCKSSYHKNTGKKSKNSDHKNNGKKSKNSL